jgi:hypothetical protein
MSKPRTQFRITGIDRLYSVEGQESRTLQALVAAGSAGITALEVSTWALRLAHHVWKLKKLGVTIDTVREKHAGPAPGVHGRYILRNSIEIVDQDRRAA